MNDEEFQLEESTDVQPQTTVPKEQAQQYEQAQQNELPEKENQGQPVQVIDKEDPSFQCPICLGPLSFPVSMPCGHISCYVCLTEWIKQQNLTETGQKCPVCQDPFKLNEIRNVFIGKQEGEDPRPRDIAGGLRDEIRRKRHQDLREEQERVQQQMQVNQFRVNFGGFQLNLGGLNMGAGLMAQPGIDVVPRAPLTKAQKCKALLFNLLFILLVFGMIVVQTQDFRKGKHTIPKGNGGNGGDGGTNIVFYRW